ncbi:MAG: hypothetical protein DRO06_01630 [Thermoproteota archaeon]|nr:MAG: hypothetical protein DRO06_01630 [Candidatus Korarchaeota archaeon]
MPGRSARVFEIMKRNPERISKDASGLEALEVMERRDITHLTVVSDGRVVGVVSAWDLMEGFGSSRFTRIPPSRVRVSSLMSEPAITVSPEESVGRAIDLMVENDISFLPVISKGELVGVLTETDLLSLVPEGGETAESVMKVGHPRVMPVDRIVHARARMLETGARSLPVVDEGLLVGLVTDLNLAKAFVEVRESKFRQQSDLVRRVLVEDVMIEPPPRLEAGYHLSRVVEAFLEFGIPSLPVAEDSGEFLGVVTRKSLLKLIR